MTEILFWNIFEIFVTVLEAACTVYFLHGVLRFRLSGKWHIICPIMLCILQTVLVSSINIAHWIPWTGVEFLLFALYYGYSYWCLEGNLIQKLIFSIADVLLLRLTTTILVFCMSLLSNTTIDDMVNENSWIRFGTVILIRLSHFYLCAIAVKLFQKHRKPQKMECYLLTINFLLLDGALALSFNLLASDTLSQQNKGLLLGIVWILAVMGIISYFFLLYAGQKSERETTEVLNRHKEKFNQNEVEILYENYLEMQRVRHDMKNHLLCLSEMLRTGHYKEAEDFCNSINDDIDSVQSYILSDNPAVGSLINCKIGQAKKRGITVKCLLTVPMKDFPFNLELCGALGNLLDNAIEANEALPAGEKGMSLEMKYVHDMMVIKVTNPIKAPVLKNGSLPETTKTDKKYHGFGRSNTESYIRKMNGKLLYSDSNGLFTAAIFLPYGKNRTIYP